MQMIITTAYLKYDGKSSDILHTYYVKCAH